MAYIKTNWVDNVTMMDDDALNKIEDGIVTLDTQLADNVQQLATIKKQGLLLENYSHLVDENGYWNIAIAQAIEDCILLKQPIIATGRYKIFADGTDTAVMIKSNVQIISPYWTYNSQVTTGFESGIFEFHGTGNAFGMLEGDGVTSNFGIVLKNIYIIDFDQTGKVGLDLKRITGSVIENVTVVYFDTGFINDKNMWYTKIKNLCSKNARKNGVLCTGGLNHTEIETTVSSKSLIMEYGLYVGDYASFGAKIKATVEIYSGRPAQFKKMQSMDLDIYSEQLGVITDYATSCVYLDDCEGGRIRVALSGTNNCIRAIQLNGCTNISISGVIHTFTEKNLYISGVCKGINTMGLKMDDYTKTTTLTGSMGYWLGSQYIGQITTTPDAVDYAEGDILYTRSPVLGGYIGKTNIGGVWKSFGLIES